MQNYYFIKIDKDSYTDNLLRSIPYEFQVHSASNVNICLRSLVMIREIKIIYWILYLSISGAHVFNVIKNAPQNMRFLIFQLI